MTETLPPSISSVIAGNQRLINRELSWLAFNDRVIDEAYNAQLPLLERLNFLTISSSNLDEFYMVRIGVLRSQLSNETDTPSPDGLTAAQQLELIHEQTAKMLSRQQKCWQEMRRELADKGITVTRPSDLNAADVNWLRNQFQNNIFPLLTPIAVDPAHPFPLIPNKGVALILEMEDPVSGEVMRHLVPVPTKIERFVRIGARPEDAKEHRFMLLERVIVLFANELIPGFKLKSSGVFRVLRNTELELDERAEDLLQNFEHALHKRRSGHVIRLGIHKDTPQALRLFLQKQMNVSDREIHIAGGLNGLADLKELVNLPRPDLHFAPYEPRRSERVRDMHGDIFAAISRKDIIVHHPYESFDMVVHFLRQAVADPHVLAIKQTLYRTSADSPIVQALMEAAHAGKSVTAVVELKARFDEEANIKWARNLERAGAQVVYGFTDLKTHAKLSMAIRREGTDMRTYVHVGTGNYHPHTARVYTDLSFFTCDPAIGHDVTALFNYVTGYAEPKAMEKVFFSPLTMRGALVRLIDEEMEHARAGKPAAIWAKMNALVDPALIEKLYEASEAGVDIKLLVRGICCLRAGVAGLSSRITVRSIVGRFLEHSRMVCFGAGHGLPSASCKTYVSSGDWMPRNLDRRIEVMVPLENPTVRQQVVDQIFIACLKDNTQSWEMQSDGHYKRISPAEGEDAFSAHEYFMKNPSLSGRGSALLDGGKPPELSLKRR